MHPAGGLSRVPRSHLYVAGDRRDHLAKALSRGADGLIIDLEDAVASERKDAARKSAGEWLAGRERGRTVLWVRVNSEEILPDVDTLSPAVSAVVVPKAEVPVLQAVSAVLERREAQLRIPCGSFAVVPLIETARGLLSAAQMASLPRVSRLAIGRIDLAAELRLRTAPDGPEFRSLMLGLVVASAAAGIDAPVAPVSADIRDLDALRTSTRMLSDLGFRGRTAVHPAQVPVINDVFTPSDEEIAEARSLVEAFERSTAAGRGVFVDARGRMVDEAVVRSARDILARTGQE